MHGYHSMEVGCVHCIDASVSRCVVKAVYAIGMYLHCSSTKTW